MIENLSLVSQEQKTLDAWNSLEDVRCHYCNCFAYPPVYKAKYYGVYSHVRTINMKLVNCCYECKCNREVSEHATQITNFPCRWRGCSFMANASSIRKHVEECPFRTLICPLSSSCQEGYYTPNTLMEHIQHHGAQYCPDPERIIVELFTSGIDSLCKEYFSKFNDELVAFMFKIEKKHNKHSWQLIMDYNDNFGVDIYFEHNHCSFKSKTFSPTTLTCTDKDFQYPKCFYFCKRIWAVLKIKAK